MSDLIALLLLGLLGGEKNKTTTTPTGPNPPLGMPTTPTGPNPPLGMQTRYWVGRPDIPNDFSIFDGTLSAAQDWAQASATNSGHNYNLYDSQQNYLSTYFPVITPPPPPIPIPVFNPLPPGVVYPTLPPGAVPSPSGGITYTSPVGYQTIVSNYGGTHYVTITQQQYDDWQAGKLIFQGDALVPAPVVAPPTSVPLILTYLGYGNYQDQYGNRVDAQGNPFL